ncbi:MAG: DEAD/DEAH box helicase [Chloroflexota bacterium]|nr:MAG: DEAD/DEAH box helicase [Chloroflexota bacterium]
MSESRTLWWERATEILTDGSFAHELRQIHGLANLVEYSANPTEARQAAPFTYNADRLYETAIQLFLATSLELTAGAELSDPSIRRAFLTIGRLLYFLNLGEKEHFATEELLLQSAVSFDLAGYTANALVALRLKDGQLGYPRIHDEPSPADSLYLLLNRRIPELRRVVQRWNSRTTAPALFRNWQAHLSTAMDLLARFITGGGPELLERGTRSAQECARLLLQSGTTEDWLLARSFELVASRLWYTSPWLLLPQAVDNFSPLWSAYVRRLALGIGEPQESPITGDRVRSGCVIDLWPSQISALQSGLLRNESTDWVIKMPTSAGKTRLAEFQIISALTRQPGAVCMYVVPYVALANETRDSLRNSLGHIGIRVADLFQGEYALTDLDQALLVRNDVIVCTPEKLDLVLRRNPEFLSQVALFVFDEGHMIDDSPRGIRYEFLIDRLRRFRQRTGARFSMVVISAVVPNASELAAWIAGSDKALVDTDWKPTEVRFGVFHWRRGGRGDINYPDVSQGRGENYYVPHVIERSGPTKGAYPANKSDICAELARALVVAGPVVIFAATKRNVSAVAKAIQRTVTRDGAAFPIPTDAAHQTRLRRALVVYSDYLGEDHDLIRALKAGFAYHTGDVPQSVRAQIELLFQAGTIRLIVCTNTLAQGVNLPIKTLLIHSIYRGQGQPISSRDFMNIAGRTARALREIEGQVVFVHNNENPRFSVDEIEVRNLQSAGNHIISSIMLIYARLAQSRAELATDQQSQLVLRRMSKLRGQGVEDVDLEEGLAALNAQLLGLLVEEQIEEETVDAQQLLGGSLFQLQAEKYGVATAPIYSDVSGRLTGIRQSIIDTNIRKRYFQTGLSSESCQSLCETAGNFLDMLRVAPDDIAEADGILKAALSVALRTRETQPSHLALKIDDLGALFLDWLRGVPFSQIARPAGVSPEELSHAIEDVFVRKFPWGFNALFILTEDDIRVHRDPLPPYLQFLAALSRYGVPTIEAAICRAIGVADRRSAMRLGQVCPARGNLNAVTDWLASLQLRDLVEILGSADDAERVFDNLKDAQLGNPGAERFRGGQWLDVEVRGLRYHSRWEEISSLSVGDHVVLQREPNNRDDASAVRILLQRLGDEMLGYLDRDISRIVSPLLDEGFVMRATVSRIEPPSRPFPAGRLYITLVESP